MAYLATKQRVHNRGVPPDSFLDQLVAWGKTAPDEIFAPNTVRDVYSNVSAVLGPRRVPRRRHSTIGYACRCRMQRRLQTWLS